MRRSSSSRGFTLIELTIALMIAALAASTVIASVNAITSASLHSTAVSLSGAIKLNYDRAVMNRRTQRLGMDLDKGTYWVEFTESPFALNRDKSRGAKGPAKDEGELDEDGIPTAPSKKGGPSKKSIFDDKDSLFSKDKDKDSYNLEAGRAAQFVTDDESEMGKPIPLPKNVHFGRVWTGHQEEPFTSGVAYLHFFPAGFTEPAIIELVDEGDTVVSIKVTPLTGRTRTYDKRLDTPRIDDDDGKKDGDL